MTLPTRSRDEAEFTQATKDQLARRAGYRCSFPQCRSPTIGPSAEGEDRSASTGMACHIRAAATGPSARRVSSASPEELRHISNGIWMCYRHGKLIDADEASYTVEQLTKWKGFAERTAQISHAAGCDVPLWQDNQIFTLAATETTLTSIEELSRTVNRVLSEAGVFEIWEANPARAIRDLLIELARNAFEHGEATTISIIVEGSNIRLLDDGRAFDLSRLRSQSRQGGGSLALSALTGRHGASVIATGRREGDQNVVYLAAVRSLSDLIAATPCHALLSVRGRLEENPFDQVDDCDTVYLISKGYISYSDLYMLSVSVKEMLDRGKAVIVALPPLSSGVEGQMRQMMPDVTFIELSEDPSDPIA